MTPSLRKTAWRAQFKGCPTYVRTFTRIWSIVIWRWWKHCPIDRWTGFGDKSPGAQLLY